MKFQKWNKAASVWMMTLAALLMSVPVSAEGIMDSPIVKGTENLFNDVTTWLLVLAPIAAGMLIVYFFVRRGAADEMDQKKWDNRIKVAVVSGIGAVVGGATLKLILSYYA